MCTINLLRHYGINRARRRAGIGNQIIIVLIVVKAGAISVVFIVKTEQLNTVSSLRSGQPVKSLQNRGAQGVDGLIVAAENGGSGQSTQTGATHRSPPTGHDARNLLFTASRTRQCRSVGKRHGIP